MSKNAIGGGKPIKEKSDLRPIELRVLQYVDQNGPTWRGKLVPDLCSPESRIGSGIMNGSNSFVPAIAARWVRRLLDGGFLVDPWDQNGHVAYRITGLGKALIRS